MPSINARKQFSGTLPLVQRSEHRTLGGEVVSDGRSRLNGEKKGDGASICRNMLSDP